MEYRVNQQHSEFRIYAALAISVMLIYAQVRNFEFVYDDWLYLIENKAVYEGITLKSLVWSFTSLYAANWHPLTWLSHIADIQIYGMNPGGHHVTNMVIHVFNSILCFRVFGKMTGMMWQSALAAVLFAIHPLHVESVAWIAERKDLLCMFFWLLAMSAYTQYVRKPVMKNYLILVLWFVCSLMSKAMAVTLPAVLLLLDYYPFGRIRFGKEFLLTARKPVLEKIPLFLLSLICGVIAIVAQKLSGAVATLDATPIYIRLSNALVSYVSYLWKMLYPLDLIVFYPYNYHIPLWKPAVALSVLGIISLIAVRQSEKSPFLLMGWLWYLGTLLPVIGLLQVGGQAMADRYTYIPLIGIFIMIAWIVPYRKSLIFIIIIATVVLIPRAWHQVQYWRNGRILFEHALEVTPNNSIAISNITVYLMRQGKPDDMIKFCSATINISPDNAKAHYCLGYALMKLGDTKNSEIHLNKAARLLPDEADIHNDLGIVLIQRRNIRAAVEHFSIALKLKPDDADIRKNLNKASAMQNEKQQE